MGCLLLGPIEWEFQLIQVTKLHNTNTTQLLQPLAIGQEKAVDTPHDWQTSEHWIPPVMQ